MENSAKRNGLRFDKIGSFRDFFVDSGCQIPQDKERLFSIMSHQYEEGDIPGSKDFEDGPDKIHEILLSLDTMFLHDYVDYNREYLERGGFRDWFRESLFNPGRLAYVVFWEVATDLDAISFEWHHFKGHDDICQSFFRGQCYTLGGNPCEVHRNGSWQYRHFNYGTT